MNKILSLILLLLIATGSNATQANIPDTLRPIPASLLGDFKDDYDISYSISDSVWIQRPNVKYHLLEYNEKGQYFIAKNDVNNPGEAGLYTRIDIMYFSNMEPWTWGFCLTVYNAKTYAEAIATASADRDNPKKGCGGYPFSRMKRAVQ